MYGFRLCIEVALNAGRILKSNQSDKYRESKNILCYLRDYHHLFYSYSHKPSN